MSMLLRSLKNSARAAMVVSLAVLSSIPVRAEDPQVALEVVAVKLKPGADMDAFRKNDAAVAVLVSKQPGFISRETGAGPEGEWFVIVHWASLKDAENAAGVFMQSEQAKASMSMIDQNSMLFKHYVVQQ